MNKQQFEKIVRSGDLARLESLLRERKGILRQLLRLLYHADEEIKENAARAFGLAARVLDEEKIRDIMRRFMWMINDESGTNSWDIPRAIGEIGKERYDLVEDHIPLLLFHAEDPEPIMREKIRDAFVRMGKEELLS